MKRLLIGCGMLTLCGALPDADLYEMIPFHTISIPAVNAASYQALVLDNKTGSIYLCAVLLRKLLLIWARLRPRYRQRVAIIQRKSPRFIPKPKSNFKSPNQENPSRSECAAGARTMADRIRRLVPCNSASRRDFRPCLRQTGLEGQAPCALGEVEAPRARMGKSLTA